MQVMENFLKEIDNTMNRILSMVHHNSTIKGLFARRSLYPFTQQWSFDYYISLTQKALWSIASKLFTRLERYALKTHLKEDVVLSKKYGYV